MAFINNNTLSTRIINFSSYKKIEKIHAFDIKIRIEQWLALQTMKRVNKI